MASASSSSTKPKRTFAGDAWKTPEYKNALNMYKDAFRLYRENDLEAFKTFIQSEQFHKFSMNSFGFLCNLYTNIYLDIETYRTISRDEFQSFSRFIHCLEKEYPKEVKNCLTSYEKELLRRAEDTEDAYRMRIWGTHTTLVDPLPPMDETKTLPISDKHTHPLYLKAFELFNTLQGSKFEEVVSSDEFKKLSDTLLCKLYVSIHTITESYRRHLKKYMYLTFYTHILHTLYHDRVKKCIRFPINNEDLNDDDIHIVPTIPSTETGGFPTPSSSREDNSKTRTSIVSSLPWWLGGGSGTGRKRSKTQRKPRSKTQRKTRSKTRKQ